MIIMRKKMLIGKPDYSPVLLITNFEGYGDLLCHTPSIRILSQIAPNLDVWCKRPEPFFLNPCIKNLSVYSERELVIPSKYEDRVILISVDSQGHFPHCTIHNVDLFSIKAMRKILRYREKTVEAYWSLQDKQRVQKLLQQHRVADDRFVVITPAITWPSRTLPLPFYQELIVGIQRRGYQVVLVGKEISYTRDANEMNKTLYDAAHFPGAISLYNQLSFAELCALYSITPIAINSQNGNTWASCTNDFCWNLFIPTLSAPEYSLPFRHGSQFYKAAAVGNAADYYPASVYSKHDYETYLDMPILLPPVQEVLTAFESILTCIHLKKNSL